MGADADSADGVAEAERLFVAAGLSPPPVPLALQPAFRQRDDWFFASREMDPFAMYMFGEYVDEAVAASPENYVAISHAGHGINSYAITYHLVYGRLALFAQTIWGGVYLDRDDSNAAVSAQLGRCATLIATYESCAAADMLPTARSRLVVVESSFRGAYCCAWIEAPLTDPEHTLTWLEHPNEPATLPTEAALSLLTAG